jgi:HNH endonuclease
MQTVRLHRLICETFHGPAPTPKHQAAHINGDRFDNRALNLEWKTHLENEADKKRHGTHARGPKHRFSAKLSEANVAKIIEALSAHVPKTIIAKWFGVSESTIRHIARGKTWKDIPRTGKRGAAPFLKLWLVGERESWI